ncbi:MAG: hypothetical protein Q9208_004113 [Pyrenodesmia sp. 3 TL-2023]
MPPLHPQPTSPHKPRVILYHQTHYHLSKYVSLLPLLTEPTSVIPITHLIIAALHLNARPGDITLNDDPPSHPKHDPLWSEVRILQSVGIPVLGMLGGAARGTFARLDGDDDASFEAYYTPLRDVIRAHGFDGLDLDVEEEMSLAGIIRLIDRLALDFGDGFLITLAPVARALQGREHLSGFDYEALEVMRGGKVKWYNVQFYNGWGGLGEGDYEEILGRGWEVERVVVGMLTNSGNGHGWVDGAEVAKAVRGWREVWPGFGGVMGWEYFNAVAGGEEGRGWMWAEGMMEALDGG